MTETVDILVIGGGIAGIGAAARLSADASVIVLEQEDSIGYHSTGRSAALFILNYGNATLRALNRASAPVFRDPGDLCKGPLLTPRGDMVLATEADLPALKAQVEGADGLESLTPEEAIKIVPVLKRDGLAGAAIEPDASDIDVERLLQGYVRLLRRNGGRIVTRAGAHAVNHNGAWRVETAQGTFEAPVLINAAGAWSDVTARMAGVALSGLTPMRRSAVIVPIPEIDGADRWPLFGTFGETWYAKPQSGRLMISPADQDPVEPHDAWPDDMVLAEGIDRMQGMTTVKVNRIERSWAGLRTFAPDRTPVVGFAPDVDGFFWLAGQGGYGIQTSPALAQLSADLILGRSPVISEDVLAALSPNRFHS